MGRSKRATHPARNPFGRDEARRGWESGEDYRRIRASVIKYARWVMIVWTVLQLVLVVGLIGVLDFNLASVLSFLAIFAGGLASIAAVGAGLGLLRWGSLVVARRGAEAFRVILERRDEEDYCWGEWLDERFPDSDRRDR